jgi:hypothetical protein
MSAKSAPEQTKFTMAELIKMGKENGESPMETRISIETSLHNNYGDIKDLGENRYDLSGHYKFVAEMEKNPSKTIFTVPELKQLFHAPERAISRALAGSKKDQDGHIVDLGNGRYDIKGLYKWKDEFFKELDRKSLANINPLPAGRTVYTFEEIVKIYDTLGGDQRKLRKT